MTRSELVERALEIARSAGRTPERGSHEWWVSRWRELATVTHGLLPDDPRVNPVLSTLAECDRSYKAHDLDGFKTGTERLRRLMGFARGAVVRWEGVANHRLVVLGPATVEQVHEYHGRLYVWVTWKGIERLISESIIMQIEGPTP